MDSSKMDINLDDDGPKAGADGKPDLSKMTLAE